MNQRTNLGLTVNGKPLDDGAGLWAPGWMLPGATCRDARASERWKPHTNPTASPVRITKKGRRKPQPAPTREQMLARLKAGKG